MQVSEDKKFPILLFRTAFFEDVLKDTVRRGHIRQTVFLIGMSLLVLFRGDLPFKYECRAFRLWSGCSWRNKISIHLFYSIRGTEELPAVMVTRFKPWFHQYLKSLDRYEVQHASANPDGRAVKVLGLWPHDCWQRGCESHWGLGCSPVVFVVCCAGTCLCDELITRSEESCRVCVCDVQTSDRDHLGPIWTFASQAIEVAYTCVFTTHT